MLKIGKLNLKSNLILAPMAGVSDLPFRLLNRKFGCELAFTEMLNVRSVSFKSRKTQQMLSTANADRPLGVQLLGAEAKYISRALEVLGKYRFDLLDFNAACPARKVVRRGEGARLLNDPKKINTLLKILIKQTDLPVTVKIRSGWDGDSLNCREVALAAEDAGISALFIHGRTQAQGYSGRVDYRSIYQVKKAVGIPVIASGDILSAELARKMLQETGCDGLLVARGALGNPWIFAQILSFLKEGVLLEDPPRSQIIEAMLEHLQSYVDFYGQRNGVVIFRKFFAWYTKGFRKVRPLREESSRAKSHCEMAGLIRGIVSAEHSRSQRD